MKAEKKTMLFIHIESNTAVLEFGGMYFLMIYKTFCGPFGIVILYLAYTTIR